MRILVSGATGFVGSSLLARLDALNHTVIPLGRSQSGPHAVRWSPETGQIETQKLIDLDAAVHLAGESIASGRWTKTKKQKLIDSRVQGTRLLSQTLSSLQRPPRVLISASAIGYYGNRGAESLREESPPGTGFLAEICKQWEASTEDAARKGIRVIRLRFGLVLAAHGGVLRKILLPFKLGIGGKIGSGNQYMSWISLSDLCDAILHCIETESLQGAVNGVSPNPVTNFDFTKTLGRVISRPTIFPLPAFAARIALGEMADELLLASTRVEPARLLSSGFRFKDDQLEPTLRRLLKRQV